MGLTLTPEKALIFRITHIDNVPWILRHGLHCRSSNVLDPSFREIGNAEVIQKRGTRMVTCGPRGVLSDYIPFYFTPRTPMLYNIRTGWQGMTKTPMPEIVMFAARLRALAERGIGYVFTDSHALVVTRRFFDDLVRLDQIDWPLIQSGNFQRDPDDPGKLERYQAEALIHRYLPIEALAGIICHGPAQEAQLKQRVRAAGLSTPVIVRPAYYF